MKYYYLLTEQIFLQLVINVLRRIVLSHCVYKVTAVCNSTLLTYDRALEIRFGFVSNRVLEHWKNPSLRDLPETGSVSDPLLSCELNQ